MNFKKDTLRASVSISCFPVGTEIHINGWSEMWVNPMRPPNHQISSDWLQGRVFTRTGK